MQGGFQNPPVGNQGLLDRPQITSQGFQTGVTGWRIGRDGNVEFNNGVFRGTVTASTITGGTFQTSAAGARIVIDSSNQIRAYDAGGNLIMTIAASAASINITGTIKVINASQPSFFMLCDGGSITLSDGVVTAGADFQISDGSGAQGAALIVRSPSQTTTRAAMKLIAASPNGTVPAFVWVEQDTRVTGDVWHADGSGGKDSWIAIPLTNGWTNAGNPPAAQFRRISSPPNSVEVIGRIAHTAVSGSSQIATVLPYIPTHTQDLECNVFGNTASPVQSPVLTLDSSGILTLFNLPTGTTGVSFHLIYSLDA